MASQAWIGTEIQERRIKTWIFGRERDEVNQLISLFETAKWSTINIQTLDTLEELVNSINPDLLIISSDVTRTFGKQLVNELRKSKKSFPILCLGKKEDLNNCLEAMEEGANDFIRVPYYSKELLYRAKRIIKASPMGTEDTESKNSEDYRICNLHFNPNKKTLKNSMGEDIRLTNGEVKMLKMLCTLKGSTVSREKLGLLTQTENKDSRTLDVRISKLKKKIRMLDPKEDYITSKRREGYKITEKIYTTERVA